MIENENGSDTIKDEEIEAETNGVEETEETDGGEIEYDDDIKRVVKQEVKKAVTPLAAEIEKKTEEYDALYDKYLRVTAEYDNFRKRTVKEKEGIYSDAVVDVLKNILPVMDNLERALQFSDAGKILEGLKMIYSQFGDSLARIGVEEIKSDGEPFDPAIHNAVFHEEDENQPDNTITETLQKGYIKSDKVIRPAMVRVVN